jgi:hypothetical protein
MGYTPQDEPPVVLGGFSITAEHGTWSSQLFSYKPTPDEQLLFEQQREAQLLCDPSTKMPVLRMGKTCVQDGAGMWHILRVRP